jgi:hypothetical protein
MHEIHIILHINDYPGSKRNRYTLVGKENYDSNKLCWYVKCKTWKQPRLIGRPILLVRPNCLTYIICFLNGRVWGWLP